MSAAEETDDTTKNKSKKEWKEGWVVLTAGFLLCFITDGFVFSYGVMLVELVEYFDETRASTATVSALMYMMKCLAAPLSGVIGTKIGYRRTVLIGAILSTAGFALSFFATNIYYLWISYGLITGLGFGLMFMSAFVCVLQKFVINRTLANGITICGTGTGTFVFNYSTRLLIDYYGWRGTVLIQAGVVLQGTVLALLVADPKTEDTDEEHVTQTSCKSSVKTLITTMFNKDLLTNIKYIVFLVASFVMSIVYIIPYTFVPDQAEQVGMTKTQAAMLASSIGIANIPSRVIFGWIGDRVCFSRLYLLGGLLLVNGILSGLSPYLITFETKLIYTCLFGTLIGGFAALLFAVMADNVKKDLMPSALGVLMLVMGVGISASSPIAGMLFDKTGSYTTTFIVCGSAFALGGLLFIRCKFIKTKDDSNSN